MKIRANGVEYDLPLNLTMGELRLMKRLFDLPHPRFLDPTSNLDHAAGLLFVAMQRRQPKMPADALMEQLDAVTGIEFDATDEEIAEATGEAVPPTPEAEAASETGS